MRGGAGEGRGGAGEGRGEGLVEYWNGELGEGQD